MIKRMKKRILCIGLILAQAFSVFSFSQALAKTGGVYVRYDMENAGTKPQYTGTGSYAVSFAEDDATKGTVMVVDAGSTKPTGANNKAVITIDGGGKITDKAVISFDVKIKGGGGGALQLHAYDSEKKTYMLGVIHLNAKETWLFNNWQMHPATDPIKAEEWVKIDVVLDVKNEKAELYSNGNLIDSGDKTASFAKLSDVSSISLNPFVAGAPDSDGKYNTEAYSFDNITLASADNLNNANAGVVMGDSGEVYIIPSSTLASNTEIPSTVEIARVGSAQRISADVTYKNGSICLNPAEELLPGTEYQVDFEGEVLNFLGMEVNLDTTFTTPIEEVEVELLSESFDTEEGLLKFIPTNGSGAETSGDGRLELTEDGAMRVMPMEWRSGAKFTLPQNMPESYKFKISYKAKLEESAGGQFGALYTETGQALNTGETLGLAMNMDSKGIVYPDYARWWSGTNRIVLIPADKVDIDGWYIYECEYEVTGKSRPTVSYTVKDTDGNLLGSVNGVTCAGESFVYPKYVRFEYARPTDKGGAALYDDIKISYAYVPNYVKSAKTEDVLGNVEVLKSNPTNAISGMNLEFESAPENISVVLSSESGEIYPACYVEGNILEIEFDEFLKAEKYTLSVDYAGGSYMAEFTPVVEENPIIADFGIFKNGEKLESLDGVSGSDTLTVKAHIYNTTGKTLTGCVSYAVYNGKELSAMNFSEKSLTSEIYGVEIEKNFSGSLLKENAKVRGFLWDKIGTLGFMSKPVEIK